MQAISSTFRSGEPALHEVLENIRKGDVQLPDFQRGWVWDDDHIRSLIASISLSYPIGAIMLMETGGDGVRFRPRPVEGVKLDAPKLPDMLILDGQQRLTSLYLALRSAEPVLTRTDKGQEIRRLYYLDINGCLNPETDRIDAVIALPPEKVVTEDFGRRIVRDVSSTEKEFSEGLFPLSVIFDQGQYAAWRRGYQRLFRQDETKLDVFDNFEAEIVQRFQQYRVPTIELLRNTPKEAVCQVFEKVNTGGVTLTVFELITATFAADDFSLRDDWKARSERLREHQVLGEMDATAFLTALTLLASYERHLAAPDSERRPGVSCKRKDVLKLTLEDYQKYADRIEHGLITGAKLLNREKVFDTRALPYTTQLIPLSAICAFLGDRFESEPVKKKIARWFWCGVFGELYGGANEFRFSLDLPEVVTWIDGGTEPRTVNDANFTPTRLLTLQTRNSAAYKGLIVRLMQVGSKDFLNGDPIELTTYFDLAVDIHHIFPQKWCTDRDLPRNHWNSIINKAPLSSRTNRILGGWAPSQYLGNLVRNHGITEEMLDGILVSHCIDPTLMRADDFPVFLRRRAARLLDLIEEATVKKVSGRDSEDVVEAFGGALTANGALA